MKIKGDWGMFQKYYYYSYNLTKLECNFQFSSVQSLSHVRLFATPWTAAHQASLSITTPKACSNSCPLSQ